MSSYVSGITFVATNDDIIFPFSTDFLVLHPICLILSDAVDFTMYNGVKTVKISLSSSEIQTFMVLITGFTLAPLCYYNKEASECSVDSEIPVNTTDICYKDDGLDILEDDEYFADFDSFVNSR